MNWQIIFFIAGPWLVIFALKFAIDQVRNLGMFLTISHNSNSGYKMGRGGKLVPRDMRNWRDRLPARDDRETLPDNPGMPRHSEKIMLISLIKYIACLFVFTLLTFGMFIYPMIFIWAITAFFSRKYIILWKAHKYSVPFLLGASCAAIILSAFVSPFIRSLLAMIFINLSRVIV